MIWEIDICARHQHKKLMKAPGSGRDRQVWQIINGELCQKWLSKVRGNTKVFQEAGSCKPSNAYVTISTIPCKTQIVFITAFEVLNLGTNVSKLGSMWKMYLTTVCQTTCLEEIGVEKGRDKNRKKEGQVTGKGKPRGANTLTGADNKSSSQYCACSLSADKNNKPDVSLTTSQESNLFPWSEGQGVPRTGCFPCLGEHLVGQIKHHGITVLTPIPGWQNWQWPTTSWQSSAMSLSYCIIVYSLTMFIHDLEESVYSVCYWIVLRPSKQVPPSGGVAEHWRWQSYLYNLYFMFSACPRAFREHKIILGDWRL